MSKESKAMGGLSAEKRQGWGDCLGIYRDGGNKPLFIAVKPNGYYTDYLPTKDGGVVLSDAIAEKNGRYVATPEIRSDFDEEEARLANLFAAAPDLLAALEGAQHFIEEEYSSAQAEALEGHPIAKEARRLYETIGAAIAKATAS